MDVAGPEPARADVAAQRRHVQRERACVLFLERELLHALEEELPLGGEAEDAVVEPVSYTHLTLPTKLEV